VYSGVRLLAMKRSFYAPSFRLKQLARSGYGFGHTARREPGDVRGTVIGKEGRFRGLGEWIVHYERTL
jgi:hypothetical protein